MDLKIHLFAKGFLNKNCMFKVKNTQAKSPEGLVQQLICNMIVTKDISNNLFHYIDPFG